jgi:hypothetical protein
MLAVPRLKGAKKVVTVIFRAGTILGRDVFQSDTATPSGSNQLTLNFP